MKYINVDESKLRQLLEDFYEQAWACGFSEERTYNKELMCMKEVLISKLILELKD